MPDKLERFTQRARRVLSLAQEAAERLQHSYIGTEHLLLGLMREEGGVAGRVLRDLGLDQRRVEELVERMTRAGQRSPNTRLDLSPGTKKVLELAVEEARRMGHHYIGTEHLLLGLVRQTEGIAIDVLKRLNVSPEDVRRQTRRVLQESPAQNQPTGAPPTASMVKTPLVDQMTTNLIDVADTQGFDPVVGRDSELQRIIQILSSRNKNRLLLVGQPGVGKTALVHGLIDRIIGSNVPDTLRNRRVLQLDPISLIAGTTHQGQFEERLKRTLEELRASNDIILFIDDVADALLTVLNRANTLLTLAGTAVPLIHAAATDNFETYLKSNLSVMNAFVTLFIQELALDDTLKALYALRTIYQEHYDIIIDDDAIEAAARLANPYIKSGVQPDKSIQLLDEAASAFVWRRKKQSQSEQDVGLLTRQDVLIILSQSTGLPIDQLQ